ncbi:MAG: hypothetical protein GQ570_03260 [Helicobacteraceae bacterium]|nr:hypothetical protein [Helicobacteraceae bacterium]
MINKLKKASLLLTLFSLSTVVTLNASNIEITIPKTPDVLVKVPEAPKVIVIDGNDNAKYNKEPVKKKYNSIGGSKRVPPNFNKKENCTDSKQIKPGEVSNNRLSAYLQTQIVPKKDILINLEKAGFDILGEYKIDKKGKLVSIIFTNKELTTSASKSSRGFASTLRLLIDKKNKKISVTNPLYIMKAFMQDEYNAKLAKKTLASLHKAFSCLENSKDVVKFSRLKRYQFMQNMPYYKDMITVAKGDVKKLLKKAKKSKKIVFEQHLDNGSVLLGVKLKKRTNKFVKKIGYQNSELLPYPVLLEGGVAKILDPKYYIAIMYPLLSMSEFMTIATIPGAIRKDCDKVFR